MAARVPFNAFQTALYQLMKNAHISLANGTEIPIYDKVPKGTEAMPYIWLGELHGEPTDQNKTSYIHLVSQQLHIWSNAGGKKEINGIIDDVVFLLTKYLLNITGYVQVGEAKVSEYEVLGELYENGESAYHGILIMEYQLEQI